MTAPCHVAVACIIAIPAKNQPLWVKFGAGFATFLTHYLCDCVPHRHYFEGFRPFDIGPYGAVSTFAEVAITVVLIMVVQRSTGIGWVYLGSLALLSVMSDFLVASELEPFSTWNVVMHKAFEPKVSECTEMVWEFADTLVIGSGLVAVIRAQRLR